MEIEMIEKSVAMRRQIKLSVLLKLKPRKLSRAEFWEQIRNVWVQSFLKFSSNLNIQDIFNVCWFQLILIQRKMYNSGSVCPSISNAPHDFIKFWRLFARNKLFLQQFSTKCWPTFFEEFCRVFENFGEFYKKVFLSPMRNCNLQVSTIYCGDFQNN